MVAVTAVAAFLQIRQSGIRTKLPYLRLSDRLESLGLAGAFTMIDPLLKRLATDPALRLRLAKPGFVEEIAIIESLLRVVEQIDPRARRSRRVCWRKKNCELRTVRCSCVRGRGSGSDDRHAR